MCLNSLRILLYLCRSELKAIIPYSFWFVLYLNLLAGDEAPAPALPDLDANRGLALEHVLEKRGDLLHPPGLQCLRTLQLASPGHGGNTADHDTSYLHGQPRQQGGLDTHNNVQFR